MMATITKSNLAAILTAAAALAVALLYTSSSSSLSSIPTDLIAFLFPPPQISNSKNHLHSASLQYLTSAFGPESIAFDPAGQGPYTGVADGRILKWNNHDGWTDFAHTTSNRKECVRPFAPEMEHVCGRPLGLKFDQKTGDLYIADAYLGIQVVGPNGGLATPLISEVEGRKLRFTNDLDIDEEQDVVYFTDTSTQYQRRDFMLSILDGDMTGRLLKYDRSSKLVSVLMSGLAFANGVSLSKDRSFVLVAETTTCRITRFWLSGPQAGKSDLFAELPGFPDNIRRNPKGEYWVALHAKKSKLANWIVSNHWVGRTLLKLPFTFKQLHFLLVGKAHATAIKLSEDGRVLEVLEDFDGKTMRWISEVEEKNGKLWIGSVLVPFVGVHSL